MLALESTYSQLDPRLFSPARAGKWSAPHGILYNDSLAKILGLDALSLDAERDLMLTGQKPISTSAPFAQAYAGHQFGHFTMLGDGRALVLGEWLDPLGRRFDIQLKGSGQTPYSRRGDGQATVSAMLREYVISEWMAGLGIATTRSLAVVATGEFVQRESVSDSAVLTRIASSHIRVGTFEYIAQLNDPKLLRQFTEYVIQRHYPEASDAVNPILSFFQKVMERQAHLIAEWMRVGFIHGVMNTDNMSIAGETIDYGPCAFMNGFDWRKTFSSIDTQGRYAFGQQPAIAQWNLACLASALLPLIDSDSDKAVELAQEAISEFVPIYQSRTDQVMRCKIGLAEPAEGDLQFIDQLFVWMQNTQADFTQTFIALESDSFRTNALFKSSEFESFVQQLSLLRETNGTDENEAKRVMRGANPYFIPRNHLVEDALSRAAQDHDLSGIHALIQLGQQPYIWNADHRKFFDGPMDEVGYQTFCGT